MLAAASVDVDEDMLKSEINFKKVYQVAVIRRLVHRRIG